MYRGIFNYICMYTCIKGNNKDYFSFCVHFYHDIFELFLFCISHDFFIHIYFYFIFIFTIFLHSSPLLLPYLSDQSTCHKEDLFWWPHPVQREQRGGIEGWVGRMQYAWDNKKEKIWEYKFLFLCYRE